jgi:antitoxin component of RelBE/YafQ-DinJ toxin-antitoxin module
MSRNHADDRVNVMSETIISVPIEESAKQHAEAALARLGLTPAEVFRRVAERLAEADEAVALGTARSDDERFLDRFREAIERLTQDPVVVDLSEEPLTPNAETIEAIEADRRGETKSFATIDELMADLHSDADD